MKVILNVVGMVPNGQEKKLVKLEICGRIFTSHKILYTSLGSCVETWKLESNILIEEIKIIKNKKLQF